MYDISKIKSCINCVDYAKRVGLPITKPGERIVSPLREGAQNKTSFIIHEDYYYDFAAGKGGDVIELCAAYAHNGDRGAAIRELARWAGVLADNENPTADWVEYTHEMNAKAAYYHSKLTEEDRVYLRNRGIKDEDADRLMIGRVTDGHLKGRLFLPYFNNGYCCYFATRAMPGGAFPDNKYMKQKKDEYCQHVPWGLQTLGRGGETLVIAEGYFDAASFEVCGYPVLSAITGSFSQEQLPTVLAVCRAYKQIFLVYDNDPRTHAGEKFTTRMANILMKNKIPFVVGAVPVPYHDVSEYHAAGEDLAKLITNAQDGITYLANFIHDYDELEKFIYSAARNMKRTQLLLLISHLKKVSEFNEKVLEELFKTVTKAPPEDIVADELMSQYKLLYITSVGFYEYKHGVWNRIDDGVVKQYADKAYGVFSTAQRVQAICNLLKTRVRSDVLFNKRPVWNFINGTLELDTGVFRDHDENDFCSIQASYPYNPGAKCPAWRKFVNDVTTGDAKAEELLQFIPAYTLFQDCPHEKIFVLTGSGGNGKSRYLAILNELFGEQSTSHLPPAALLDKFQVIQLRESIINLAGEIRSDLRDVEERMKAIASGEPISGCYKGEQFVTFKPRTKLVFATNGQLTSEDTSDGLVRRLVIIDFKAKFVECPDPRDPYQRPKDINILDKLHEELETGGIFNWVYEGYKLLRQVGYFTETYDQEELIGDFKRASNPVLAFYEESFFEREFNNAALYIQYTQWCTNNGERPLSSRWFHREFKKVAGGEFEPYRNSKERGYRRKPGV